MAALHSGNRKNHSTSAGFSIVIIDYDRQCALKLAVSGSEKHAMREFVAKPERFHYLSLEKCVIFRLISFSVNHACVRALIEKVSKPTPS